MGAKSKPVENVSPQSLSCNWFENKLIICDGPTKAAAGYPQSASKFYVDPIYMPLAKARRYDGLLSWLLEYFIFLQSLIFIYRLLLLCSHNKGIGLRCGILQF